MQAMGIVCKACGQTSRDPEFCDHCNGDLHDPPPAPPVPSLCPGRPPVSGQDDGQQQNTDAIPLTADQQAVLSRPEASLLLQTDNLWQRVHWIAEETLPLWTARLRERLSNNSLACLPPAHLIQDGPGAWMIVDASNPSSPSVESSASGNDPWASPLEDVYDECERLLRYLSLLVKSIEELHAHGLVWLTFDPRHIEQSSPDQLRFTNLDMEVYPAGHCPERLHLRTSFAAPEIIRYQLEDIGPGTDVFHLALFAYYWLAGLLPDGFAGEGLEAMSYQIPKLRIYNPRLPPGIAGVLARGLSVQPGRRFATPKALARALEAAVDRNRKRLAFHGKVRWDIGADTRTGRTKTALGKDNEDRVLVRAHAKPDRALLAVADGITTCAVGSGALASLIVTIVLENTFDDSTTREMFEAKIGEVCSHGAHTLLAWAVEKGYREQLEEGADLMGTTLTAAWLEGNVLSVANLGDSRAYLVADAGIEEPAITDAEWRDKRPEQGGRDQDPKNGPVATNSCPLSPGLVVEQLTVDGDLASGMLAEGVAPETIRDVGPVAKALRECIGGCAFDDAGEVTILMESCNPTITRWPLLPGDVIVLCSDGLVEEGAFMEPETLGEMIRAGRHLSAQDLARQLALAADNLHRLPSLLEPEGFGDNISCIVIKIEEGV
jgi:serine/threonine protein phosphatase PrpC